MPLLEPRPTEQLFLLGAQPGGAMVVCCQLEAWPADVNCRFCVFVFSPGTGWGTW